MICRHNCGLVDGYCTDCERQVVPEIPNVVKAEGGPFRLTPNGTESTTYSSLPETDAERKALPILAFLTEYFPDVIIELTKLCVAGNIQHNPHLAPADIKWAREKSKDQLNTAFRHLWDRKVGVHYDADGCAHLVKMIWRGMAQRQLDIEAERAHEGP